MHLKDRLGDVETDRRNRLHAELLRIVGASNSTHIFGTYVPVEEPSTASGAAVSDCSKVPFYSITSSARASSAGGTSSPSVLAVLRLITNSYLVGACTGRSAGFSPLRMRST